MRIIGIVLLSLFIFVGHVSAMDISLDQAKMCNTIKESLRYHPELWIVTSYRLIYIPDPVIAKHLRTEMWPETDSGVGMIIKFDVYQVGYVHIDEPFKMEFKGESAKIMIIEVKKFLYRHFRNEVGYDVSMEEEQRKTKEIPVIPDPIVEKPVKIGGLNRL